MSNSPKKPLNTIKTPRLDQLFKMAEVLNLTTEDRKVTKKVIIDLMQNKEPKTIRDKILLLDPGLKAMLEASSKENEGHYVENPEEESYLEALSGYKTFRQKTQEHILRSILINTSLHSFCCLLLRNKIYFQSLPMPFDAEGMKNISAESVQMDLHLLFTTPVSQMSCGDRFIMMDFAKKAKRSMKEAYLWLGRHKKVAIQLEKDLISFRKTMQGMESSEKEMI